MLEQSAKIFVAGHRGLVGSAIWNNLKQRGYTNLTGRTHQELDLLIDALAAGLEANSTTVKTAMENYIAANGGTAMPLTDSYGKTEAHDLELGLYLLVETKVPEMVTSTTDPFLVSVPMTTVNGNNTDGGKFRARVARHCPPFNACCDALFSHPYHKKKRPFKQSDKCEKIVHRNKR